MKVVTIQRDGGLAAVAGLHHGQGTGLAGARVAGRLAGMATGALPPAAKGTALALVPRRVT